MITFGTLLLGLLVGVQPVTVLVSDETAAVEIWLDGERVERLEQPPWRFEVDLGESLVPHELEAVAFDADGAELGRAVQRVNLLRQEAEATIALDAVDGVPRQARLVWRTIDADPVTTVRVTLDGAPLEIVDPSRIPLPALNLEEIHFLVAELTFESGRSARAEAVFGGLYGDEVSVELTAVPVLGDRRPTVAELAGRLHVRGEPVTPVGVDHGTREVFLVVAADASSTLTHMARAAAGLNLQTRHSGWMNDDSLSLLTGTFEVDESAGTDVFEVLRIAFPTSIRPLKTFLAILGANTHGIQKRKQRLLDAAAMGGLLAEGRQRPRLVVLVVDGTPKGRSRFEVDTVRTYLETLRVPLVVWNVGRVLPRGFSDVVLVDTPVRVEEEIRSLRDRLDRQTIVWLEGRHLPQDITLVDPPPGIQLLGER
ncbi:MAG: hypothetical protein AAGC60_22220 [Acidobacteriota bacterium]